MRDYDPTTGRYIQADPLELVDGAGVYGYALHNPVMNMDLSGQCIGPAATGCARAALGAIVRTVSNVSVRYLIESKALLRICLTVVMPANGGKKPK